ncbi:MULTISPECIES: DUF742 domain-containing protein [unclassified Pseudonocardia]|uniref:DUF742 domain-containing protein n=1 Tax=unclassified Pseudonocardia TaxID=2619320 RepID=UPI000761EA42|nr:MULTISPECIES: DUF742 domain-containing protein [unclassified Pseudonocardia]
MARSDIGRTGARFGAPTSRHAPDPEHPHGRPVEEAPEPAPEPAAVPVDDAEPPQEDLVGVTGARFGGHSVKRKRKSRKERAAESAAAETAAAQEDAAATAPDDGTGWETAPLPAVVDDPGPVEQVAFAPVRPYVITGGRTRVRMELRLETLVSVTPVRGPVRVDSREKAVVLGLCAQTRSVSEVAALASVPLGVARVLIDDLAGEGRLTVHGVSSAEDGPSMKLMDRVLAGLRKL